MSKRYIKKLEKHFQEILEIKTTPHEIALGFSIGTFFANFPTLGLEFLIIFLLIIILKNSNPKVEKLAKKVPIEKPKAIS